jgi:hypothetical protein
MRLLDINGRPRFKNVEDRRISWNGESKSKFQQQVKFLLHPLWYHHNPVYEEFPIYGTRYTLDFFNGQKKIAIEVQGGQHTKFTKYFQASEFDYLKQLKIDETKLKFCELNNITLVEVFWNDKKNLSFEFLKRLIDEKIEADKRP